MDIYELIHRYKASSEHHDRIAGSIIDNLNDRRGIKQALQSVDGDVMEEIFTTMAKIVAETK